MAQADTARVPQALPPLPALPPIDTEQLATFERIVRDGSFSRAARSLGIAQPTVSARVQALEQAVGGALFSRRGRGVALTDLGLSFLPYARRAAEVLAEGVEAARQAQGGARGRVTIGVLESLSGAFLGPVLGQYHAAHPAVDVVVRAGRHEQLVALLRDGVVGLALICWPCADAIDTPLEPLVELSERVVLVAAPSHPLARSGGVAAAQLAALARPFLLLRWWVTLPAAVAAVASDGGPVVDVPMDTGRQMVLGGVGAGFFPWAQVADALADGRLSEVPVRGMPPLTRTSALVRRASAPPVSPAAADMVAAVASRARQLGL